MTGRVRLFARGLLMLLSGFGGIIASIIVVVDTRLPSYTRVLVPLLGMLLGAVGVWLGVVRIHAAVLGNARLRITRDRLEVEHPILLRSPLSIPRHNVAVASVDTVTQLRRRIGERTRFVAAERRHDRVASAALYSSRQGSPLPLIGHSKDVPNVAVLFREPVRLDGARGGRLALFTLIPDLAPAPGQRAKGLLLNVTQPSVAAAIFRDLWRVLRPLTLDDLARVAPDPDEWSRRRRISVLAHAAVVAVFVLTIAITLLLIPLEEL